MDEAQPTLIRGDDLRAYIKHQREKRKAGAGPDTFYCFSCKKIRNGAANMADCTIIGNRAKLTALCATCETVVSKSIGVMSITDLALTLDITITRHEATL